MNQGNAEDSGKFLLQLTGLHSDLMALSKKNPNDAINKFKIKIINDLLTRADKVLDQDHKPFPKFEPFEEDALPTNSDAVLMISQYYQCVRKATQDFPGF